MGEHYKPNLNVCGFWSPFRPVHREGFRSIEFFNDFGDYCTSSRPNMEINKELFLRFRNFIALLDWPKERETTSWSRLGGGWGCSTSNATRSFFYVPTPKVLLMFEKSSLLYRCHFSRIDWILGIAPLRCLEAAHVSIILF
jgi:hypothetical protein